MIRVRSHTSKSNASKFIPSKSESKLARIPSKSESKLARIPSKSESKLARIPSKSESKLARIPSKSEDASLYNRIHVTEGASGAATEGDAAENLLASTTWFDELATACAERGVRGVRPALFDGLRPKLATCPVRLTQEQAAWCAEEIMYANRRGNIRNPTGLLIHIVKRVLDTGETGIYIEDTDVTNW